jgi:adhesin transport system membrane fusion protein
MKAEQDWSDADFVSEVDAAWVRGPNPRSKILLLMVFGFFLLALIWARFAILDEVTHANGTVIPSSRVQVIQNLEGGILKEILVEEGSVVRPGQVVLRIDKTSHAASFGELQARYFTLQGDVQRLTAEAEGTPLEFSPQFQAEHPEIVTDQQALFQSRQGELKSQIAILQQQLDQRKQEKAELESKLSQAQASLKIANEEYAITEPLVKKNIVPKVKQLQLQREINDLKGDISAARLAIPRAESAIAEASRRVEEKVQTAQSEILTELSKHKTDLAAVQEEITAAKDRVARTEVRSPVKGVVKELKIRTIGGVIQPGQDLMEILPIEDNLRVEAQVRPADIAFLRPGQDATVKFTAYDSSIYGGLPGKVERISADTIVNKEGDAFYKVTIRTDKNYLIRNDQKLPIIPGMVATVDIITGQKSVLTYLMKPIIKAKENALRER